MRISLIVPVYNELPFLKRCFDSIENQTRKFDEVIVIDDGSTDGSSDFIDKYDKKFIIHHIRNLGVSYARNLGMEISSGDYITFLDSDDELLNNACENMYNTIIKYPDDNIFQFNHLRYYAKIDKISHKNDNSEGYFDLLHATECNSWWGVWNKIIRKEAIKKGFRNGLNYGEDGLFNIDLFLSGSIIHTINIPAVVHHFENKSSLSHLKTHEDIRKQFHVYISVLDSVIDTSWCDTCGLIKIINELCEKKVMKEVKDEKNKG